MKFRFIPVLVCVFGLSACVTEGVNPYGSKAENAAVRAANTQVTLGVGYLEQGRVEEALERFQRAIAFDPRSASAYTSLGVLYEQISRPDLAEKNYAKAVQLEPRKGAVHNNFGQFLCRVGRYEQADAEFKVALNDPFYDTPAIAATNAGKCARASGQNEQAEKYLRLALSKNPNAAEVYLPLASVLHQRGQSMNARAFLQRFEASGLPQDAEYLRLAAQVESRLGDTKAANAYRERLENEFPAPEQTRSTEKPNNSAVDGNSSGSPQ